MGKFHSICVDQCTKIFEFMWIHHFTSKTAVFSLIRWVKIYKALPKLHGSLQDFMKAPQGSF